MGIQPFRRRIGISSPGSLLSGNAPQIADVGPSISRAASQVFEAAQPAMRAKAVREGQLAASKAEIVRDEQGRALSIDTPEGAGLLYQQAFEQVAQARYVSQVSLDFQTRADAELEAMRSGTGGKKLDAEAYRAYILGTAEGILEVADPRVRPVIEATLAREGLERTRAVYNEVGQRTRQDQIAGLNTDLARYQEEIAKAVAAGAPPERIAQLQADAKRLIDSVAQVNLIGPRVAQALGAKIDADVQDAAAYAESMTIANQVTPPILGLSFEALQTVERWMTGVNVGDVGVKAPGLNFGDISTLHPKAKQALQTSITDRKQNLATLAAEARHERAENEREARRLASEARTRNAINGMISAGAGAGFTAEQKGLIDDDFNKQFKNLAEINTPEGQKKAIAFVNNYQYVPGPLVNFMANGIRSGDPFPAIQFYRNITLLGPGGAMIGDLLLEKVDPRSRALLTAASDLMQAGQTANIASSYVERMRSGNAFTPGDAIGAFNSIEGDGKPGTYTAKRDKLIKQAYGIPERNPVPAALAKRIDVSYAASLDVYNRDPAIALEKAIAQNKAVYTMSPVFFEGVGPTVLTRSYTIPNLGSFFGSIKENGKPLVPPVKGVDGKVRNHVIGNNGTIKLIPLDDSVSDIGRYEVRLFDPSNRSRLIDKFEIDLGLELNKWSQGRPTVQPPNLIEQAKRSRTSIERRQGVAMTNPAIAASMTGSGAP
jgi:hypothetical protein